MIDSLSASMQALYRESELLLAQGLQLLPDKPEESAASTLRVLWLLAAGEACSVAGAAEQPLVDLREDQCARLEEFIRQRLAGTPLAHLSGRQRFMGLDMLVSADALVPREETQLLGNAALGVLRSMLGGQTSASVIDVCTGSGNLALAIATHEPRASVHGADLSESAIALARENAGHLQLASTVNFRAGDLLAPFDTADFVGRVDMIVCNPPYISSAKVDTLAREIIGHEPRLAFDGGPLGISIVTRLIKEAPRFLRPGGWLCFEVGLGQGRGMHSRLVQQKAFDEVREVFDDAGNIRALLARTLPAPPALPAGLAGAEHNASDYQLAGARLDTEEAAILARWRDGLYQGGSAGQKLAWYYHQNVAGLPLVYLLRSAGEPVGAGSVAPREMRRGKANVLAHVPVDFVISPAHRSLFPALFMQRQIRGAALKDRALVFTAPNEKSMGVFMRVGYKRIGELVRSTRVLRSAPYLGRHLPATISRLIGPVADFVRDGALRLRLLPGPPAAFAWEQKPDDAFDALFARCADSDTLLGVRNAAFLAWRFGACPFHDYRFFTMRSRGTASLLAYAACRVDADHLYVDDFLVDTAANSATFWRALALAARREGHVGLSTSFLGERPVQSAIAAAGLIERGRHPVFASASTALPGGLAGIRWYLTAADFDT